MKWIPPLPQEDLQENKNIFLQREKRVINLFSIADLSRETGVTTQGLYAKQTQGSIPRPNVEIRGSSNCHYYEEWEYELLKAAMLNSAKEHPKGIIDATLVKIFYASHKEEFIEKFKEKN